MKANTRRRLVVGAALLAATLGWWVPRGTEAHTCAVLKTTTATVHDGGPSCRAESDNPPSDHICPFVTTTQVTALVCVDLP